MGIAFDQKGKSRRKWQSIRSKQERRTGSSAGLTGAALEQAVMALMVADSSLVKIEARS